MTRVNSDAWTARADWAERLNQEGSCLDIRGVVPLDEDSLLEAARRHTGLSNFGDDPWRAPFRVLLDSLENVAELNLLGR
ncbi:MAG: hypothetical protein ABWZ40_11385, partial [Caulobacterales bacterium]